MSNYKAYQIETEFFIAKENLEPALQAIKDFLLSDLEYKDFFMGARTDHLLKNSNFIRFMKACGWNIYKDREENIAEIWFNSDCLTDEDDLFRIIAPLVKKDSFIGMMPQDSADSPWCWYFDGQTCEDRYGKVIFDIPVIGHNLDSMRGQT